MLLKQSTAHNRMILMVAASDHVTGLAGLTLTITASKDGAAFGSITPTVTDRGSGWYNLALTSSHTDTLGELALHITGTAADPTDIADQVLDQLSSSVQTGDSFARLGAPAGASVSADIDAVPTATENADALLKRDMSAVTGESARSPINALRFLRNKRSAVAGVLTVTKEDDTSSAWTATLTAAPGADPISAIDPA